MIVKSKTHKRITALLVGIIVVGILLLLRIVFVLGVSAYMNAEAKKQDGNQEVIATYYMLQAGTGDFMEPYIAYYNAGTSLAKANNPELAEQMLTTALAKVDNAYNECYVRNNLAKVQEQLGDYYMVSDFASTAETYYKKAVTTISESPSVCFPPPPPNGGSENNKDQPSNGSNGDKKNDPNGEPLTPQDSKPEDSKNGQNMKDTEDRSKAKGDKAKAAQGDSPDGKEEVKKEMGQSKSETQNQKDLSDQQKNQSPNPVDKPW